MLPPITHALSTGQLLFRELQDKDAVKTELLRRLQSNRRENSKELEETEALWHLWLHDKPEGAALLLS